MEGRKRKSHSGQLLSLSLKRRKGDCGEEVPRFSFACDEQIESLKDKTIPPNTEKATQWAMKTFCEWSEARKKAKKEAPPDDLLISNDEKLICKWLCSFFTEVRKSDGNPYCPRSLASLLGGLHRYIELNSEHKIKIQKQDGSFGPLHNLLENLYRKLHEEGIGTEKVQAEIITQEEEQLLWSSQVLNSHTPEGLLHAVFYYNGLNFVLRGGAEHRNLSLSQLTFGTEHDPNYSGRLIEYVDYTEFGSKNRPGGSKQLNLDNKVVRQYAQPDLGDHCHVYLLKLYISKLPLLPDTKDLYYLKPLKKVVDSKPWFSVVPIGHNKLDKMLKEIFCNAGIEFKNKSNHSLRATAISRMYRASLPEKVIMERSGHLSKEGVRAYEHTSNEQVKTACKAVTANSLSKSEMEKENDPERACSDPSDSSTKQSVWPTSLSANNPIDEALKPLSFQTMNGCTFNISLNFRQ